MIRFGICVIIAIVSLHSALECPYFDSVSNQNKILNNTCDTSDWLHWNCSSCFNGKPNQTAVRHKVVCCPYRNITACRERCNTTEANDTEYGSCSRYCLSTSTVAVSSTYFTVNSTAALTTGRGFTTSSFRTFTTYSLGTTNVSKASLPRTRSTPTYAVNSFGISNSLRNASLNTSSSTPPSYTSPSLGTTKTSTLVTLPSAYNQSTDRLSLNRASSSLQTASPNMSSSKPLTTFSLGEKDTSTLITAVQNTSSSRPLLPNGETIKTPTSDFHATTISKLAVVTGRSFTHVNRSMTPYKFARTKHTSFFVTPTSSSKPPALEISVTNHSSKPTIRPLITNEISRNGTTFTTSSSVSASQYALSTQSNNATNCSFLCVKNLTKTSNASTKSIGSAYNTRMTTKRNTKMNISKNTRINISTLSSKTGLSTTVLASQTSHSIVRTSVQISSSTSGNFKRSRKPNSSSAPSTASYIQSKPVTKAGHSDRVATTAINTNYYMFNTQKSYSGTKGPLGDSSTEENMLDNKHGGVERIATTEADERITMSDHRGLSSTAVAAIAGCVSAVALAGVILAVIFVVKRIKRRVEPFEEDTEVHESLE